MENTTEPAILRYFEEIGRGFKSLLLYFYICPGAWNWDTDMAQTHVSVRTCGFESRPGYFSL